MPHSINARIIKSGTKFYPKPPLARSTKDEVDAKNLSLWNLDESSRENRKLNDESDISDDRYRNIDKPHPLL